jgi:23S rRNA pseudouridine1911/1915/1917 synthase
VIKKYTLKTTLELRGQRLDHVLAGWLPQALSQPVSKAKARKLIVAGAVYLNGKRVRIASKELMPNATVDVYVDLKKLFEEDGRSKDRAFEMTAERILYEDEYLIVVDKPPGLPTQPTLDEARDNLFASVKKFLAKREGVVEPYLALHHRLDRDTSGVILFAKAKEANAGVAKMFSEHLARKTYNAISAKAPGRNLRPEWVTRNYLGKVPGRGKQAKYGAVRSGGDPAETQFRLNESWERAAWIEASPITGRTHQIRVHLSEAGLPIVGDALYGGPSKLGPIEIPRLMLHAVRLTFPHPIHQTEISVQSPLPEDFLQCIRELQGHQKRSKS